MHRIRIRFMTPLVALALAPSLHADTGALPSRFDMSIKVMVNPVQGHPRELCHASVKTEPPQANDWWIAFGDTRTTAPEGGGSGCGLMEDAPSGLESASGDVHLFSRLTTSARHIHEGSLSLLVSLSLRRHSGLGTDQEPIYDESEETREFFLSPDTPDAVFPLLLASPEEQETLGVHEVILMLEADMVGKPAPPYGRIRVVSEMAEADLLLDGGVVGVTTAGADTFLPHVPVGLREVRARDASGNEAHRIVRVIPERTLVADLSPQAPGDDGSPYGLVSLGKNTEGYEEYSRARDGAVVVKIPAGEFVMGNPKTERQPLEHPVYLSEFLMDKTAVTWRQYVNYAGATGVPLPPEPFWGIHDDHPVVFVTWEDARGYCEWVGGRLPTEAEREKAARGTDTRMYPWGEEPPDAERAVHRRSWGFEATDPVGTHPSGASPYGLLDMAGNVWEWCMDWYDKDYYAVSPRRDPRGPATGTAHVVRGGSWDSRPAVLSCSCRSFGNVGYREGDFGFRCVMNAPDSTGDSDR